MKVTEELAKTLDEMQEKLESLTASRLDDRGRELPNPKPMVISFGMKRPESLQSQIQRIVKNQLSMQADLQEKETFEESQDFDVGDDDTAMETRYTVMEDEDPSQFRPEVRSPAEADPLKSAEAVVSEHPPPAGNESAVDEGNQEPEKQ